MNITSGLIAKSAAALAVVATAATALALSIGSDREARIVKSLNEKLENLGLPKDCRFEDNGVERDCGELTEDVLKAINFDGKGEGDLTITWTTKANGKLKIRKDGDENDFPGGIKIIFEVNDGVTIKGGNLNIDWKLETNPEYKIKEGSAAIESSWTLEKLIEKINLSKDSGDSGKCNFGSTINVFEGVDKYTIGAKIKDNANGSKKLSCSMDSPGHNQGLLLSASEENGIALDNTGAKVKGSLEKIEKNVDGTSYTYQIKEHEVDGIKHWFLSKK